MIRFIQLTDKLGKVFLLNVCQIETIVPIRGIIADDKTVITLASGREIIVHEEASEVEGKIVMAAVKYG